MKSSISRLCLTLIAIVCGALPVASAHAQTAPIIQGGFGDSLNSYAWSMAWFKGKLYVGTARHFHCVEAATIDYYYPNMGFYSEKPAEDLSCPKNRYDMDLRAEIWQYTPETSAWTKVFRSPADVPNPDALGKFVARDIGFRGMLVFKEPNGEEALYVAGVTANEYIPDLKTTHPPRILRTTDGTSFTPLPTSPEFELKTAYNSDCSGSGTFAPDCRQYAIGFRAMAQYKGRMFVTASSGLLGDGVILEVKDPSGPAPTYTQVSPKGMQIFEMEVFDSHLYVGTGDSKNGYSVLKTDAATAQLLEPNLKPYSYTPIVTGGAGRGYLMTSVVAMHPFEGKLYVGASGWYGTVAQSELIRINQGDSWDLVVGNPRLAWDLQFKYPISNLPDGFGNPFNAHFWRMQAHEGELQLGTNDWSWGTRRLPGTTELASYQYGFDVFGTCDGKNWEVRTSNAYGFGLYNFGARTMASSSAGLFTGSANHKEGTAIWRGGGACLVNSSAVMAAPQNTRAVMGDCGTDLSWRSSAGATSYSILRSQYEPTGFVPILPPPLPGGLRFDPPPGAAGVAQVNGGTPAAGPPQFIKRTTATSYRDTGAKAPGEYLYHVVAERGSKRSFPALAVARPDNGLLATTGTLGLCG